jgi:hypothetical protein
MSLATYRARRVDLLGFLAVLIAASALMLTVVLLTVAPRVEPAAGAPGPAASTSTESIEPRGTGYVRDAYDARFCDSVGNCLDP